MGKRFACHKISEGCATAEVIKTNERIMFYQVRPEDGMMDEKDHEIRGKIIAMELFMTVFRRKKGSKSAENMGF